MVTREKDVMFWNISMIKTILFIFSKIHFTCKEEKIYCLVEAKSNTFLHTDLILEDYLFFLCNCECKELKGQLSILPNFTNWAKIFHINRVFNLNVKRHIQINFISEFIAAQGTAHQVHIEAWEKQINNNYNEERNRKHCCCI